MCIRDRLFPTTRDPRDQSNEVSVQGYFQNTLNPAMPDTHSIVRQLVDDLCRIFPGKYIHPEIAYIDHLLKAQ